MITLTINGKAQRYDGDPEMPLWVLRDELNLKGTKFGCGMGVCGAAPFMSTASLPVRALMSASDAADKSITTIEGVSVDGGHPVQVARAALDVPQGGYCQAGQIMRACALLAKRPNPTDVEIDSALDGKRCRCGTYQRIHAAVHQAAKLINSRLVAASGGNR